MCRGCVSGSADSSGDAQLAEPGLRERHLRDGLAAAEREGLALDDQPLAARLSRLRYSKEKNEHSFEVHQQLYLLEISPMIVG